MISLIQKLWERKVVRFGVVGFLNFSLDFLLLNIFAHVLNLPTLIANSLSVAAVITISYFVNHRIVFRHPEDHNLKSYFRFFMVTGFSAIIIQDFIIHVLAPRIVHVASGQTVQLLGVTVSAEIVEVNAAKIVAVAVGMVWNFLLYKFVVFRHPGQSEDDELLAI